MKNYFLKIFILLSVLIVLLVLCCYLALGQSSGYEKESVYKIVSYLGERGISVDPDIIDIKKKYAIDMDLESVTVDKSALSKNILLEDANVLADTYTSESGTVAFKGNDFSFKSAKEISMDIEAKTSLYDIGKKTQKLIENFGFDVDSGNITVLETADGFRADITKTTDGVKIFNNCISIEIKDGKFNQLWGRWYYPKSKSRDKREVKPVIDALVLFSQDNINNKKIQIKSIELGYLLTDTSQKTTTLRPVWQIKTDTQGDIYIDA